MPDGDSAVQLLVAALKRYKSFNETASVAGGEGRAHVRFHAQRRARALLAAGEAGSWRSQACEARPSCMLGADPGRAPRLPGEAEGRDAAAGARGSRIVLRLCLAELYHA